MSEYGLISHFFFRKELIFVKKYKKKLANNQSNPLELVLTFDLEDPSGGCQGMKKLPCLKGVLDHCIFQ